MYRPHGMAMNFVYSRWRKVFPFGETSGPRRSLLHQTMRAFVESCRFLHGRWSRAILARYLHLTESPPMRTQTMTSRFAPLLFVALMLCPDRKLHAATPGAEPAPAPPANGSVFSLGTISIAPSPQNFSGPAVQAGTTGKPQQPAKRQAARRPRRVSEPVPLRIYSRI